VARLPVFNAGPMLSVYAVMRFPRDIAKASALASWAICMNLNEASAAAIGPARLASIASEGARFAPWLKEMRENEYAGGAAGEVVKELLTLLAEEPKTASLDNALDIATAVASKARGETQTQMAVSKSSLRHYLSEFGPALHLWGAWRVRGARWLGDPSAGYSHEDDFEMFLCESECLLEILKQWDSKNKKRSDYLKVDFFRVAEDWRPPARRLGWPMTGVIPKITIDRVKMPDLPTLKKRGRPAAKSI